jgi:hypothetical protein
VVGARTSPHSKRLCVMDTTNQPLIESAQNLQMRVRVILSKNVIAAAMHPCPKK